MKTFGQKKMVRKMKFISDQEGIMHRYLREKDNWAPHLENTQQFILDSFKNKGIKSVAVLGSGWLLDLPLKDLSERFKKVLLIDVYHPPQIKKKVDKYKNITLFETDITGGAIKYCWDLRKEKDEHFSKYILDDFKAKKPDLPSSPDAFISLNILNQLDILLVDYLSKKNGSISEIELERFRKNIQQFHLDWITKKPGCLISDVAEINSGPDSQQKEQTLVHVKLPKAKRKEEWTWDFDLSKKYRKGTETRMNVNAIEW
ncbi:MAG: hypothetical protein PF450_12355 [Bacteroidales bacterium]|jgi:hypothetical protein|nr:hypothetical protein [Bacteroidales bacterium]